MFGREKNLGIERFDSNDRSEVCHTTDFSFRSLPEVIESS